MDNVHAAALRRPVKTRKSKHGKPVIMRHGACVCERERDDLAHRAGLGLRVGSSSPNRTHLVYIFMKYKPLLEKFAKRTSYLLSSRNAIWCQSKIFFFANKKISSRNKNAYYQVRETIQTNTRTAFFFREKISSTKMILSSRTRHFDLRFQWNSIKSCFKFAN